MNEDIRFHKLVKELKGEVGRFYGTTKNEYYRERLKGIYDMIKNLEQEIDLYIEDMNEMYLRNSAFPGDLIGWLDDDFTYDDEADDNDDTKS